jgi:hypothetical protein
MNKAISTAHVPVAVTKRISVLASGALQWPSKIKRNEKEEQSSLTMLGVSRAFLSTLLPALRGERHFALIENSPSSTQARV